jgi:hypothetical protein
MPTACTNLFWVLWQDGHLPGLTLDDLAQFLWGCSLSAAGFALYRPCTKWGQIFSPGVCSSCVWRTGRDLVDISPCSETGKLIDLGASGGASSLSAKAFRCSAVRSAVVCWVLPQSGLQFRTYPGRFPRQHACSRWYPNRYSCHSSRLCIYPKGAGTKRTVEHVHEEVHQQGPPAHQSSEAQCLREQQLRK